MRTILVTGSDTGVGKTQAVAALARLLAGAPRDGVQIVKAVETGADGASEGDATRARRLSGRPDVSSHTLASFPRPLAPAAAAAAAGAEISLEMLLDRSRGLPGCAWRLFEGAGGIASPIDAQGLDWADFARAVGAVAVVVVVPDRIGSINQARLGYAWAVQAGLHAGVWLNAAAPVDPEVADANRKGLQAAGVPIWAEQGFGEIEPRCAEALLRVIAGQTGNPPPRRSAKRGDRPCVSPHSLRDGLDVDPMLQANACPGGSAGEPGFWVDRCVKTLSHREKRNLRRTLHVTALRDGLINMADNDTLALARDPAVVAAVAEGVRAHGTSASASPLITGWREPHEALLDALGAWHGFPCGLLWTSGYAANAAVLGTLPQEDDLVFADRLIHHSMIAGLQRSGARLRRYPHLDLDRLEAWLADPENAGRPAFVVTESVFSMEGDFPDLARIAELRRRHRFCWVLDEAHALGWYGPEGSGLARAVGVEGGVDILVGTLGKTLASGGAYSLFRDVSVRDALINLAGEFIYSTALPPANAAGALAALARVRELAPQGQSGWRETSRQFRYLLRERDWDAPEGDSPIVPVRMGGEEAAVSLASWLREAGILAGAVRPPTVPAGTSRLRFSLKRTLTADDLARVVHAMGDWRDRQ